MRCTTAYTVVVVVGNICTVVSKKKNELTQNQTHGKVFKWISFCYYSRVRRVGVCMCFFQSHKNRNLIQTKVNSVIILFFFSTIANELNVHTEKNSKKKRLSKYDTCCYIVHVKKMFNRRRTEFN